MPLSADYTIKAQPQKAAKRQQMLLQQRPEPRDPIRGASVEELRQLRQQMQQLQLQQQHHAII